MLPFLLSPSSSSPHMHTHTHLHPGPVRAVLPEALEQRSGCLTPWTMRLSSARSVSLSLSLFLLLLVPLPAPSIRYPYDALLPTLSNTIPNYSNIHSLITSVPHSHATLPTLMWHTPPPLSVPPSQVGEMVRYLLCAEKRKQPVRKKGSSPPPSFLPIPSSTSSSFLLSFLPFLPPSYLSTPSMAPSLSPSLRAPGEDCGFRVLPCLLPPHDPGCSETKTGVGSMEGGGGE